MVFLFAVIFISSCIKSTDLNFDYGLLLINNANEKYNSTMQSYPKDMVAINSMLYEFSKLKETELSRGHEAFILLIDFRLLNLESEKNYMQSQKYGDAGSTKKGFGCKSRPLIIESSSLRNISAIKGFKAVDSLNELLANYPREAAAAGLSSKDALFLNASFYQISKDAAKDSRIINNFCPKNETLEIYKQEIRKKTNLSEDYINKLTYDEAVLIWKKERRLE